MEGCRPRRRVRTCKWLQEKKWLDMAGKVEVLAQKLHARDSGSQKTGTIMAGGFLLFVVFFLAVPLFFGIAIAPGGSPALGIITGIIGGLVVGLISGSPLQVSGPAAGLSVVVFEAVQKFGVEMLAPILLLVGLLQLVGGWLKLGRWFRAISPAVIYGMLS